MRSYLYASVVAILASSVMAQDVKPIFEFVVDPSAETYVVADRVTLPVNRENPDRQCISHPEEVGAVSWYTESGQPTSNDYCLYLFYNDGSCHGDVSEMSDITAHVSSGTTPFSHSVKSSVIRVGQCPEDLASTVPPGSSV